MGPSTSTPWAGHRAACPIGCRVGRTSCLGVLIGLWICNYKEELSEPWQEVIMSVNKWSLARSWWKTSITWKVFASNPDLKCIALQVLQKTFSHTWRFQEVKCNLSLEIFNIFSIGQAQQKHYLVYTSEYNGSSNIYTGIVEALGSDSFTLYVL